MRLHIYTNKDEYIAIQMMVNKQKIKVVWAKRSTIKLIAAYISKAIPDAKFGICHGTRTGTEQAWFREMLGIDVIGTEISDTASQFPNTIQWDFHDVKDEWVSVVDFIYTNSLDHSHSPLEAVSSWLRCLRPGGLCFIEWTNDHGVKHITVADCFGASIDELREFLPSVYDEIIVNDGHIVFVLKKGVK